MSLSLTALCASLVWLACDGSPTGPIARGDIDEVGGEIRGPGVRLSIPPGAVSGPTNITVRTASPLQLPPAVGARRDSILPGTLFEFGPDGLTFATPATLTLSYDDSDLPPGGLETRLAIARIDETLEVLSDVVIDTVANTVSVEVDHFTFFGVYGPLSVPDEVDVDIVEEITFSDSLEVRVISPIDLLIEEVVEFSDSLPLESRPPLFLEVRESIAAGDAVGAQGPGVVRTAVSEAVAILDQVDVTVPLVTSIEVREAIGVQDASSATTPGTSAVDVGEAITVSDAVTVTPLQQAQFYVVSAAGSLEVFNADGPAQATAIPLPTESSAITRRPGSSQLWITERTTDSVTVVDAETNSVIDSYYSVSSDPFTIDFDDAGAIGVIGDNDATRLTLLDGATGAFIAFVSDLSSRVTAAEVSGDGTTAWAGSSTITRVDLTTRLPVQSSAVGAITFATDMDLTPDESELWVTDGLGGVVVIHDPATLAVLDSIPLPASSSTGGEQLGFTEDGSAAYVTTSTDGQIVVIDVATRSEIARLPVGQAITQFVLDPVRNRIYASSGRLDDEVLVYDLGTQSVVARFTVAAPRELVLYP